MKNELYHHGIKGMKWGIRRNRSKRDSKRTRKPIASKKILGIGIAVVASGLAIYGGYKLGLKGMASANREISDGKKWVNSAIKNMIRNPLVSEVNATFKGNDLKEHSMTMRRTKNGYEYIQDGIVNKYLDRSSQQEFQNLGEYAKAIIANRRR